MTAETPEKEGRVQNNPVEAPIVDDSFASPSPAQIAANITGLRPDQVLHAVKEYRAACLAVESEPEWTPQTHMSGRDWGAATYISDVTCVMLTVENWKERGEWKSGRSFSFKGHAFEQYAEARAAELAEEARFRPTIVGGAAVHEKPSDDPILNPQPPEVAS